MSALEEAEASRAVTVEALQKQHEASLARAMALADERNALQEKLDASEAMVQASLDETVRLRPFVTYLPTM